MPQMAKNNSSPQSSHGKLPGHHTNDSEEKRNVNPLQKTVSHEFNDNLISPLFNQKRSSLKKRDLFDSASAEKKKNGSFG